MTIADEARDNALHCEMVKYAYRQTKDGVVVSFVVHPNDIPAALSTSHIGARYMVALVQIGDDEKPLPINQPAKGIKTFTAKHTPAKPSLASDKPSEKAKRDWRDVQPAAQAGIRCGEPVFVAFLRDNYGEDFGAMEGDAAATVRFLCGVNSRAELGTKHAARMIWKQLDDQFQAWKALEHA